MMVREAGLNIDQNRLEDSGSYCSAASSRNASETTADAQFDLGGHRKRLASVSIATGTTYLVSSELYVRDGQILRISEAHRRKEGKRNTTSLPRWSDIRK
jgi:hypothetical protein